MESRSGVPAEIANVPGAIRTKRRYYRHKVHTLAYINLDHANGGIIREISEAGVAVQAVAPLSVDQQVHLRFELLNPRTRLETTGRVVWADAMGQAGVEFLNLPQRGRRLLKEWLFTQLLLRAYQAWGTDSVFIHRPAGEQPTELLFSGAPRPALALEAARTDPATAEDHQTPAENVSLAWCPLPISVRGLSRLLDALILTSAVLLFSVLSLAMTHVFPTWPVGLSLVLAVASIFACVYWVLFVGWTGGTPGTHLAQLACAGGQTGMDLEKEERPRFR
jgi:hypothetical protein